MFPFHTDGAGVCEGRAGLELQDVWIGNGQGVTACVLVPPLKSHTWDFFLPWDSPWF